MDAPTPNVVGPTMLGVVASVSKRLKVWPVSNIAQQHVTGVQTEATCTIQQCWVHLHVPSLREQQVIMLRVCEPLDGIFWWNWIVAHAANKNGACFKNYHRLSYLSYLFRVQKRQSFLWNMREWSQGQQVADTFTVSLGLWSMRADMRSLDGVLCNSCKTALSK